MGLFFGGAFCCVLVVFAYKGWMSMYSNESPKDDNDHEVQ